MNAIKIIIVGDFQRNEKKFRSALFKTSNLVYFLRSRMKQKKIIVEQGGGV